MNPQAHFDWAGSHVREATLFSILVLYSTLQWVAIGIHNA